MVTGLYLICLVLQDSANTLLEKILQKELNPDQLPVEVQNLGLHAKAKVTEKHKYI